MGVEGFVPQLLPYLAQPCQCSSGSTQLQLQGGAGYRATASYSVAVPFGLLSTLPALPSL